MSTNIREIEICAKAIAKNYIERRYGVTWFNIFDATEATPLPEGKVKETV